MIAETVIGGFLGGVLRLAPEALRFWDRERDRKHEVEMQRIALEFAKASPRAKSGEFGDPTVGGAVDALAQTIREQFRATGTKLDWISVLVRPATTYALIGVYVSVKAFLAVLAYSGAVAFPDVVRQLYTNEDYALLGGILAFWFADRALKRAA